jgi:hypothetical protein
MESAANALAGSVAGLMSMTILYPFDNVRTRLQVQRKHTGGSDDVNQSASATPAKGKGAPGNLLSPAGQKVVRGKSSKSGGQEEEKRAAVQHVAMYSGAVDCARKVIAREGVGGLYKGITSGLLGIVVSSATYFFWYDVFKRLVLLWEGRLSAFKKQNIAPLQNSVVAFAAGSLNVCTTLPLWLLNTRMKLSKHSSMMEAAREVYAEHGMQGFYRGLVPSLILVINPVVQFVSYDVMTRMLFKYRFRSGAPSSSSPSSTSSWIDEATDAAAPDNVNHMPAHKSTASSSSSLTAAEYFVCAAGAKALATVLTYPYQVVKERLQAKAYQGQYKGTWDAVKTMYREEGLSVFFRGLSAKIVQSVLNAAFLLVFFEKIWKYMMHMLKWIAKKNLRVTHA